MRGNDPMEQHIFIDYRRIAVAMYNAIYHKNFGFIEQKMYFGTLQ